MEGLEPPRLSAPDPKSGTATNYATCAFSSKGRQMYALFFDFTKKDKNMLNISFEACYMRNGVVCGLYNWERNPYFCD